MKRLVLIACTVSIALCCGERLRPHLRDDLALFVAQDEGACIDCRMVDVGAGLRTERVAIHHPADLVIPLDLVESVRVTSIVVGAEEIWVVHAFLSRPGRRLLFALVADHRDADVVVAVGDRPMAVQKEMMIGDPVLVGTFESWPDLLEVVRAEAWQVSSYQSPGSDLKRRFREIEEAEEDLF